MQQREEEGCAEEGGNDTEFEFRADGQQADGDIGGQDQRRAAQRTGQQQLAGLVAHERSQQVGHHEAHETNGPGHGDRAAHRQGCTDDELQLQATEADAKTARGVLAEGEAVEGLGGAEQESPATQHQWQHQEDMVQAAVRQRPHEPEDDLHRRIGVWGQVEGARSAHPPGC